jgi:hypothetical protein
MDEFMIEAPPTESAAFLTNLTAKILASVAHTLLTICISLTKFMLCIGWSATSHLPPLDTIKSPVSFRCDIKSRDLDENHENRKNYF